MRFVAKKAADNGYLTIEDAKEGFVMKLTELGTYVIEKRLEAEDKAADAILSGLTDDEKAQLAALCDKISATAEEMGVDYSTIQKRNGRKRGCGKGHKKCHKGGHGHHGHGVPKYVFVFGEQGGHCHGRGHGCGHKRH